MEPLFASGAGLAYRDEGAGPALLALSANPGDSRDYDAVAAALARRFRLIRVDWPGYGASPAPQPPSAAGAGLFLERFSRFMDELNLEQAHLLGNSVGGNVAVRYALAQPRRVRSLVLVSSGGFTDINLFSRAFCAVQGRTWVKRLQGTAFTRWYLHARNPWTAAMIERAGGSQATAPARAVDAAVWRSFTEPGHDLRQAATGVRAPTLVVNGRRDPVIRAGSDGRNAVRAIPGARQVVLDCGHAPFAEVPQAFLDAVLPFWSALEASHAA